MLFLLYGLLCFFGHKKNLYAQKNLKENFQINFCI